MVGTNQRTQIRMSQEEVGSFLHQRRTMSMATVGADGRIHVVAMWYGFLDGDVAFETTPKSQKAVNLRRDPRLTVMAEDGTSYDRLRGVEIAGWAEIIEDPDQLREIGISVVERYQGPLTERHMPLVEHIIHKRIGIRLHSERVVSWDHRKLALPPM
jgi:PPOX class probable F420-dependent enzyme